MSVIRGIDHLNRVNQLGMFGNTDETSGLIVARRVLLSGDIFSQMSTFLNQPVGAQTLQSPALAAGYLYEVNAISMYWVNGGVTFAKIGINNGLFNWVHGVAALAANDHLSWSGSIWMHPTETIVCQVNVTVVNADVRMYYSYIRSPYPA